MPAVLQTTLPALLAQVSLVSILPRTRLVRGLHGGTTEPCYELDWDKGWLSANVSLLLRGTKHLRALQSTGCP